MSTPGEALSVSHVDQGRSLLPFIHITDLDSRIKFKWLHLLVLVGEQQTQIATRDTQGVGECFSSGLQADILYLLVSNSRILNSLWF